MEGRVSGTLVSRKSLLGCDLKGMKSNNATTPCMEAVFFKKCLSFTHIISLKIFTKILRSHYHSSCRWGNWLRKLKASPPAARGASGGSLADPRLRRAVTPQTREGGEGPRGGRSTRKTASP